MPANICSAILKSGKRAGSSCGTTLFCINIVLLIKEYTLTNKPVRSKMLTDSLRAAIRKGQQCNNKAKTHGFCGIHIPKIINV